MVYRALGLMSGSSLDGLDLAFVEFSEQGGVWSFRSLAADCYAYPGEWSRRLEKATTLSALDYCQLHVDYGHYLGKEVNRFISQYGAQFQVALIASHGHTVFHSPETLLTTQLGDGAALAAETGLPVISDLRAMDLAFGGQGAPIVPMGEKYLFSGYPFLLNIGGIANITRNGDAPVAFDICPANRVLNLLAAEAGKSYDDGGNLARSGNLHPGLHQALNELDYYKQDYPKSLANSYGTDIVYPLIRKYNLSAADALRTYTEHLAEQVAATVIQLNNGQTADANMLITGGGAFNDFLVEEIRHRLLESGIGVEVPESNIVQYKEALIMAFLGVLRWREENTVLASVTGAKRGSIGGALWLGQS